MYCDHETCSDIEDFIKFYINYGPNLLNVFTYQIGFQNFDQTKKKAWVRFESTAEFRISKEIIVRLRRTYFNLIENLSFDSAHLISVVCCGRQGLQWPEY